MALSLRREREIQRDGFTITPPASDCAGISNQLPSLAASCCPGNSQACSCPAKERGRTLRNEKQR
ncbi:hypothetical protein ABG768_000846, partial [Culter alburnus]